MDCMTVGETNKQLRFFQKCSSRIHYSSYRGLLVSLLLVKLVIFDLFVGDEKKVSAFVYLSPFFEVWAMLTSSYTVVVGNIHS